MLDFLKLAGASPLLLVLFVIWLFATTTFIPFKVLRDMRTFPLVTYGLMAVNIFAFLVTVSISNVNLPADQVIGKKLRNEYLSGGSSGTGTSSPSPSAPSPSTPSSSSDDEDEDGGSTSPPSASPATPPSGGAPSGSGGGSGGPYGPPVDAPSMQPSNGAMLHVTSGVNDETPGVATAQSLPGMPKADTIEGYQKLYQMEYATSSYVMQPHYSVLEWLAYRANKPTLLGIFGSMFLHSSVMHLVGNMLFLWVFGRAMEESLGKGVFIGAYLLSGVAAVLAYHVTTMQFMSQSAGIPCMGASGAIAGVMGYFGLRFYRTPVRIFYFQPFAFLVVNFIAIFLAIIAFFTTGVLAVIMVYLLVNLGFLGFVIFNANVRKLVLGTFNFAAMWCITKWLLFDNTLPAVMDVLSKKSGGGVAYSAHIGGLLCGFAYSALIGGKAEGKQEYLLEDAQKAIENGDAHKALTFAENVLEREPNNAEAILVTARAHEALNDENASLDAYERAIAEFLSQGERGKAAATYIRVLDKHDWFILPAPQQAAVAGQMFREGDMAHAAETLVKIPYTYPDASEAEVSLLRSAQLYVEHLQQPQVGLQLLTDFLTRYPNTQWLPQAQRSLRQAQHQLMSQAERTAS